MGRTPFILLALARIGITHADIVLGLPVSTAANKKKVEKAFSFMGEPSFWGGTAGGFLGATLVRSLTGAGINNLRIATIAGGSKRNAIPREAAAVVSGPKSTRAKLRKAAAAVREAVAHESAEPNLTIQVASVPPREAGR